MCSHARALLTRHTADLCVHACFQIAQFLRVNGPHTHRESVPSSPIRHQPTNVSHGSSSENDIFRRIPRTFLFLPTHIDQLQSVPVFFEAEGRRGPHNTA